MSFTNSLSRTSLYLSLKTSFVYSNLFSLAKTVSIRCYIQTSKQSFACLLNTDWETSLSMPSILVLIWHANDCHNWVIPDYVMNVTAVYHGDAMLRQYVVTSGAPNENIIQNHAFACLNVTTYWNSFSQTEEVWINETCLKAKIKASAWKTIRKTEYDNYEDQFIIK